jgi:hypothetical protein
LAASCWRPSASGSFLLPLSAPIYLGASFCHCQLSSPSQRASVSFLLPLSAFFPPVSVHLPLSTSFCHCQLSSTLSASICLCQLPSATVSFSLPLSSPPPPQTNMNPDESDVGSRNTP